MSQLGRTSKMFEPLQADLDVDFILFVFQSRAGPPLDWLFDRENVGVYNVFRRPTGYWLAYSF